MFFVSLCPTFSCFCVFDIVPIFQGEPKQDVGWPGNGGDVHYVHLQPSFASVNLYTKEVLFFFFFLLGI